MPATKTNLEKRLENYRLFLAWLKANEKRLLQEAYRQFVSETGLEV